MPCNYCPCDVRARRGNWVRSDGNVGLSSKLSLWKSLDPRAAPGRGEPGAPRVEIGFVRTNLPVFGPRLVNPWELRSPDRPFPLTALGPDADQEIGVPGGRSYGGFPGRARLPPSPTHSPGSAPASPSRIAASDADPNPGRSQIGFVRRGGLEDASGSKVHTDRPLRRSAPARKLASFGQNRVIRRLASGRGIGLL